MFLVHCKLYPQTNQPLAQTPTPSLYPDLSMVRHSQKP